VNLELNFEVFELLLKLWPLWAFILAAVILAPFIRKFTLPPFKSRALLNKSERRLFPLIVAAAPEGLHVMCQVSYGEFLSCTNRRKFWSINAKRADFVICDPQFQVVTVVEYQGAGHNGRTRKSGANAQARDAQKRLALGVQSRHLVDRI